MQFLEGDLVVSPTDLTKFLACRHLTGLDLAVARGEQAPPPDPGEALEQLFRRGLEHEYGYLARLREQGLTVVEIDLEAHGRDRAGLAAAERATVAAMAGGADVVYQGTFFDGRWRGHADFLLRRDDVPGRWAWSYDVADTKLSRRMKVPALLQMAAYAERLTVLQGVEPQRLVVVTGDGLEREYPLADCAAYARRVRAELLEFVADPPPTRPRRVSHCGQCRWLARCEQAWRSQDDLALVAGLRRHHALALQAAGISTVRQLAGTAPGALPTAIGPAAAQRLVSQAALQITERDLGRPVHRLLDPLPGRGLALLPQPSPGDVFFDMEGDPFVTDRGLEYLFGVVEYDSREADPVTAGRFTAFWATDPERERAAFEQLVDHLMAAWQRDPGMHVYHYAPYEPSRLKALSGRYDTRVQEIDRLLRGERLVDLYGVVRQGLQIGKESYSIKKMEDFYWGHGRGSQVSDAMGSVVAFERWILEGDDTLLEQIRTYNEEDCRSTRALRDWLEDRRVEGGGDAAYPRPEHGDGSARADLVAVAQETDRLVAALAAAAEQGHRAAAGDPDRERVAAAVALLGSLLHWHRRESLPQWWEFHHRLTLSDEELVADSAALAGFESPEPAGEARGGLLWRMAFPPQDTRLTPGESTWLDPRTRRQVGEVVDVRPDEGWLVLRRATGQDPPAATALIPGTPVPTAQHAARLCELAAWVLAHGIDAPGPDWRVARALLLRTPPRPAGPLVAVGERPADAVARLALDPEVVVLPVQGPPGTGKTYAGARLVVQLVRAGLRVGVCALSHKAIGLLLEGVVDAADEAGVQVRIVQKADRRDACVRPQVTSTTSAREVEDALGEGVVDVVAGTSWLFARAAMSAAVDVLVVDEAGQLSLATVVALSHAARRLVLLGDPQQLAQPVQGQHPPGAEVSALEHLLDGHPTVPPERGVLLDSTFRMHPELAGVVSRLAYEGRLRGEPGLERQRVISDSPLGGTGLRWFAVEHSGRTSAAGEEADLIADLVARLLAGGRWRDALGRTRDLQAGDILVLAPYNQQVHRIRQALAGVPGAGGLRVGTVDKLQGQEAPVVLYSLTSSSGSDAPRGTDFLLSLHRLNVALSRARAVVGVIGSPALLTADVRGPDALRRVNALCIIAEQAQAVRPGAGLAPAAVQAPALR